MMCCGLEMTPPSPVFSAGKWPGGDMGGCGAAPEMGTGRGGTVGYRGAQWGGRWGKGVAQWGPMGLNGAQWG